MEINGDKKGRNVNPFSQSKRVKGNKKGIKIVAKGETNGNYWVIHFGQRKLCYKRLYHTKYCNKRLVSNKKGNIIELRFIKRECYLTFDV